MENLELMEEQDVTGDGKHRTVEDILRAKGETIRKGRINTEGDVEWDGST